MNASDVGKFVEHAHQARPFALPGFLDTGDDRDGFVAATDDAFSRVVTLTFDHGASRERAVDNLHRWEFYPGALSECYYEPEWDPHGDYPPETPTLGPEPRRAELDEQSSHPAKRC